MDDSDLERLRRDTNRELNFNGEDTGLRVWSRVFRTWAGRFQRGRVQEIIRSVEARPGDEATVAEVDLRLEEWASAELKSVAADFSECGREAGGDIAHAV